MKMEKEENNERLLRDKQVAVRLGVSRCFVWQLSARGVIPKPLRLGRKMSVWKSVDIQRVVDNPEKYFGNKAV